MYCFDKNSGIYIEGDFEANAYGSVEISINGCS